jgi:predicted MPP superfamily phosphohydrolase
MITRRRFLKVSGAALGFGAGAWAYAWRVEPHWLEIVERRLPVAGLPKDLAGSRLVQLSDLHIGPRVDDAYLIRSFQRVKQMAPEFVVYTGDFTSREPQVVDHARRMFSHLPLGRRGTVGILGNHDYGLRWSETSVAERIAALAADAGVRVLRNEFAEVGGLHIIGLDDLWAGRFDPAAGFRSLPAGAAALVLSHNPDTADLPGWGTYSGWILAGHTHGGQCKPPFLPPPLLPVRNRRYTCGEFELPGGRRMYISRGLGHLLTVRFNVRPEITVFHLEAAHA